MWVRYLWYSSPYITAVVNSDTARDNTYKHLRWQVVNIIPSYPTVNGPSTGPGPWWPDLHPGEPFHGQQALPAARWLIS